MRYPTRMQRGCPATPIPLGCTAPGPCAQEDQTISKGTYPLKLPQSIKCAAERLAKQDGVSLNQWNSVAAAQKVGVVETAAELLRDRAGNSRPEDLRKFVARAPAVSPMPGDEIDP
jgi:hypothetical protein